MLPLNVNLGKKESCLIFVIGLLLLSFITGCGKEQPKSIAPLPIKNEEARERLECSAVVDPGFYNYLVFDDLNIALILATIRLSYRFESQGGREYLNNIIPLYLKRTEGSPNSLLGSYSLEYSDDRMMIVKVAISENTLSVSATCSGGSQTKTLSVNYPISIVQRSSGIVIFRPLADDSQFSK